jgi:hypothetical protein
MIQLTSRARIRLALALTACLGATALACDGGGEGPPTAVPNPAGTGAPAPAGVAAIDGAPSPSPDPTIPASSAQPTAVAEPEPEPPPVPDFQIATRIRNRILADEVTRGDVVSIRVAVRDGAVTLTGTAQTALSSLRAQAIAEGAFGASGVTNQIQAPAPTGDEAARAAQVPPAIAQLEPQFAPGVANYATGELIEDAQIVRPATPSDPGSSATGSTGDGAGAAPPATETSPPAQAEPATPPREPAPTRSGGRSYTVQSGDTLSSIAAREMGAASRWRELFQANERALQGDPNHVRPGTVLTIPE